MKRIPFLVMLLLYSLSCFAQDTIIKRNNSIIVSQVTEILPGNVKYKKYTNLNGPVYTLPKRDVSYIRYSNGTVDTLNPSLIISKSGNDRHSKNTVSYGNHIAYLSLSDFAFGLATVGYEFIFNEGRFSIKAPISIGLKNAGLDYTSSTSNSISYELNDDMGYYNSDKIFSAGLDMAVFPGRQGMVRYFFGPGIEYGQFYYYSRRRDPNSPQNQPSYIDYKERAAYTSIMFRNGVMFQPLKNLTVTGNLGVGIYNSRYLVYDYTGSGSYYDSRIQPTLQGSVNVGYRF